MKIQRKYQIQWKLSSQISSILPGDALCIKNQRKSTKIKENQRKTIYRLAQWPWWRSGVSVISRRRRWCQSTQKGSTMPMVQGAAPAVAGDGRSPPSPLIGALSERSKIHYGSYPQFKSNTHEY